MIQKLKNIYLRFQIGKSPQANLVWGFFLYVLLGFLLLILPWVHKSDVSVLDNLFTAVSAVSTTGLVTINIFESYNFFGQLIILGLFQIGGIGYMTLTIYFLLVTTKNITHWHQRIISAEFTLPKTIRIRDFINNIIWFTIIMELLGTIMLFIGFYQEGITGWRGIWFAFFHSVSSFCTAGFSLFENSLVGYDTNVLINTTVSILAISGSLGFIVITDLWYRFTKKSARLYFTTKIILYGFILLLLFGTIVFYLKEDFIYNSEKGLTKAFFQAMTSMTTVGMNTVSQSSLSLSSILIVIFLMFIGASPSGTAGGLKITTFTAMIAILKSRLFGNRKISFLKNTIPFERLYVATSTFVLYTSLIFIGTCVLSFFENFEYQKLLFEVASALGTVGLSLGITGSLSNWGKLIIILLMFVGRVGVLTFGFALLHNINEEDSDNEADDLAV